VIEKRAFVPSDFEAIEGRTDSIALFHKQQPNATFIQNGKIMASGGFVMVGPGIAEAWLCLAPEAGKSIVMEIRRQMEEWIRDYSITRVQSVTKLGAERDRRFLEWLGMSHEGDFSLYARTK
jgi:hypothetical protein